MTFSFLTPSGRAILPLTALIAACQVGGADRLPDASLNLRLAAPIATWDEAIPLGNGLMGGLLWGEANRIRLSLDRGDLWDERPAPGNPLGTFTYAWCRDVGQSLAALLKPGDEGRLILPTSSSPEIHDNSQRAWLKPNSNYDLAILRMLFLSLREMAGALGKEGEAERWGGLAERLGDFHADPDGTLRINVDEPLPASHRHFSNLMNIYPFNLTTIEGSDRDRAVIRASLEQYDRLGTSAWCGYSFSWMSALRARVGDSESALRHLDLFVKAFILRNGFHANGDQTKSGFSTFTYRPFTLEGNFLAAAAVHEMLLQSWNARPGIVEWGPIRIFPATPWRWHHAAFDDLRAEGGHRVSAKRENNATTWFRVVAGRDGVLRIRDNFAGCTPRWNRDGVSKSGRDFEVSLRVGEAIEATLERPATVPPVPVP
ncbi:MAG TPA: glycoside hydrolase N-terminal domain-containing protein [Verrucomicrobiota bacterium]|nr:glycoside hydrolase N-terminal domain-containing protein [Verrucomicrobiota bacterium]HRZ35531.1 glycoside hydrolase N-terminal domain-containing protein [Candidatus Paceibacterota bacterium]HRZ53948.1 glycoside hydrolase N-terminal domain-containing protein [Candidatus Paceibacterota bacterium]